MPVKELSPMEKVKLAKSAAEQAKVHAKAVEQTAIAEERLAKAVEKRNKAEKMGLSKRGMDEYNKAILEANESLEQHQKEQEKVGKGTTKLSSQYSKDFVKAIQASGKVASKSFANLDKKGQDLWYHQADAARKYAKEGKTVQREILESQAELNIAINKLSGDKSKITKEQISTLQAMVKTEEQLVSLNEDDRKIAKRINDLLKKKLGYMDAAADAQADIKEKSKEFTKYLDMAKDIWKKMKTPAGAIMLILTAIAAFLKKALESVKNVNEQLGVGVVESGKIALNLASGSKTAYAMGFGKNIENAAAASANISGNLDLARNSALAVSDAAIAMQTGLSPDNVAELAESLAVTTDLTREGASAMLGSVASFAKMNKVAPKKVMEDLANSAETLAKYSDGTAEGMARAAVHAAKLGLNLSKVGTVADNLLDLESSIAAEFEAQVLTGKDLNLDRARQLALNNDLEGVMNEIVSQVGSEAEFQKMNAIEREALAKAVGMSTEDLAKVMSKGAGADIGGNFEDKSLKSQADLIKQGVVMEDKANKIIDLIMGVIAAILGGKFLASAASWIAKKLGFKSKADKAKLAAEKKSKAPKTKKIPKPKVTKTKIPRPPTPKTQKIKPPSAKPPKWVGKVATPRVPGGGAGKTVLKSLKGVSKIALPLALAVDAIHLFSEFTKEDATTKSKAEAVGGVGGGWVAAAGGAKLGAMIGTMIAPGLGTAIGGVLGGAVGYVVGSKLGKALTGGAVDLYNKVAPVVKAGWATMTTAVSGFAADAKKKILDFAKVGGQKLKEGLKKGTDAIKAMGAAAATKVKVGLDKAATALKSFAKAGGLRGWFGRAIKAGKDLLGIKSKEKGGPITKTGSYLVGEAGPELVNLSAGSSVVPNKYMGGMQEGQFGTLDTASIVAAINSLKADLNAIKYNTGTTSDGVNRIKIGAAA